MHIKREKGTDRAPRLDPDQLPWYTYSPLRNNEFRLVVLLKGQENDDIHVEIVHESINTSQGYAALSYVWGDRISDRKVIVVNSHYALEVTSNLWKALKRIRACHEDLVLWIDAISINQDGGPGETGVSSRSAAEKSRQIQNMRFIFPRANRVLCWLGDDEDDTVSEAFYDLKRWSDAYNKQALTQDLVSEVRKKLVLQSDGRLNALDALFSQPYWRRAWCLQEVCVDPSRPPRILCGHHELCWTTIMFGFLCLTDNLEPDEVTTLIGNNVIYVLPMLETSWCPPENMYLSDIIRVADKRECSIPHDTIFSLLGLAERRGVTYPAPDYQKSIEDTCMLFTRAIIAIDGNLSILAAVDSFRRGDRVPSWCLKPGRWVISGSVDGGSDILPVEKFGRPPFKYNAALGMRPLVEEPSTPLNPVLNLLGLEVDKIVEVMDIGQLLKQYLWKADGWNASIQACSALCFEYSLPEIYPATGEDIVEAFLRTITCDDFWLLSPSSKRCQYRERFFAAYRSHLTTMKLDDGSNCIGKDQLWGHAKAIFTFGGKDLSKHGLDEALGNEIDFLEDRVCSQLREIVGRKLRKRKLILTENGYIGIGPPICEVADIVCIMPGSTVPLILRPVERPEGPGYRVVGDAYLHGVMYGEALERERERNTDQHKPQPEYREWKTLSIV